MSYAPVAARPALATLFALDERFGAIVAAAREPTIGLMRLAWWREALERLDRAPAPAEPLLQTVAQVLLPRGVTGVALAEIEHGWSALLDGEIDATAIARHGRDRGGRLFAAAASLLTQSMTVAGDDSRAAIAAAGSGWALADLSFRHSDEAVREAARRQACLVLVDAPRRWPRALRALGALTALAVIDAAGDGGRAQGSPWRLSRMLAHRLFGR